MRGQQERTERGRGGDEGPPLPAAGAPRGWRREEGEAGRRLLETEAVVCETVVLLGVAGSQPPISRRR